MISPYELRTPTQWASPPKKYSFSSLQAITTCPRRWQLLQSRWGDYPKFPERAYPPATEGKIIHSALDRLLRELGHRGNPPIGSAQFQAAAQSCGFWTCFGEEISAWNNKAKKHPRTGPIFLIRSSARELTNRAIRLFRERYSSKINANLTGTPRLSTSERYTHENAPLSAQLRQRGTLSEVSLSHPSLPLMGIVDLLTIDMDGHITLIDFKTGEAQDSHRQQLLLYAVLWWRTTGLLPHKIAVQYLFDNWDEPIRESDLMQTEQTAAREIANAEQALSLRPGPACPSAECARCAVRARCDDGWPHAVRVQKIADCIDVELLISTVPTDSGFTAQRPDSTSVSVVYNFAVGGMLPALEKGMHLRLIDAQLTAEEIIEIRPWSEVYRL